MPPIEIPIAVFAVACICFLGAYGIVKRRRWAWYAGWVVQFFFAGAACTRVFFAGWGFDGFLHAAASILVLAGYCILWTGWAVWWANRRVDFGVSPDEPSARKSHPLPPKDVA